MRIANAFAFSLVIAAPLAAQQPAVTPARPAAPPPPIVSPEVAPDGRATVRLRAPGARSVVFARDGAQPVEMTRDSSGTWSYTTPPLEPDIYPYTFRVDGVTHPDPANPDIKPVFRGSIGQSLLHIPGPSTLSWETTDVPHGAVARHWYRSRIIGDQRDYYVYTPPGYDPRRAKPYPVLYLLHGMSDDASGWISAGRANFILDNLIAQRKAEPMLVVMTLGYGAPEIMSGGFWGRPIDSAVVRRNVTDYVRALVEEVIPDVERTYDAGRARERRAIAGLSMGGGQSLAAGIGHAETFAWVGAFSSATGMLGPRYDRAYPQATAALNDRLKLLWMAIGKDDFLYQDNVKFRDWLTSRGVKYEWHESEGGHTWMNWRRYLTDFAPRLFR